jgi:hypothetical protein
MAVTIKNIELWRSEVANSPGTLAATLAPLADAGADLRVVMGYRYPGKEKKAAIEVFPVKGKKSMAVAQSAGLQASGIPTLVIEGDNEAGLGRSIAQALADAGINVSFFMAQVVGDRYSAVAGFESQDDARSAAALIKKATGRKKK